MGVEVRNAGGRMRPASNTARRDVSPLLGEAERGKIGGVVEQGGAASCRAGMAELEAPPPWGRDGTSRRSLQFSPCRRTGRGNLV